MTYNNGFLVKGSVILIEFFLLLFFERFFINFLKSRNAVQHVREELSENHKKKEGTPRGGGIVFLLAPLFILPFFHSLEILFIVISVELFGLIGLIDDVLTFRKNSSEGLSVKEKLLLHFVASIILFVLFKEVFTNDVKIFSFAIKLPTFIYFLLFSSIFVGSSNAFNLTDGVDGLLGSVTSVMLVVFLVLSLVYKSFNVTYLIVAFLISIASFLWYNSPKASIFMGDTGSTALGALIAAISIAMKVELYLPIVAIIPVIEALSIFIQVAYFKKTHGKRVFKMTPIHHHFELSGFTETQIDYRFSIVTLIAGIIFLVLKLYFG